MDGFTPLNEDDLKSGKGARQLNIMLQKLFNTAAGDGTTISDFTGYGSPEAVLTAGIGATYRRIDGGSGSSFYIKSSGTGNTGWTAVNIVAYPLSVANGGTGGDFSATAQGTIPYFSATGVLSGLAPGTAGQFLETQGAAANPLWANLTKTIEIFTTSGTWTCPTGINAVEISLVGAGGGGGGSNGAGTASGGGGSGAYLIGNMIKVVPTTTYTVTIGALGAGGVGDNDGTTGGLTSMVTAEGTVSCAGGVGGVKASAGGTGGGGGASSGGTYAASTSTAGARFITTAGASGGTRGGGNSGGGASGPFGKGATGVASSVTGANATGYGAGGSGEGANNNVGGGAGSPGIVIIKYNLNGTPA